MHPEVSNETSKTRSTLRGQRLHTVEHEIDPKYTSASIYLAEVLDAMVDLAGAEASYRIGLENDPAA